MDDLGHRNIKITDKSDFKSLDRTKSKFNFTLIPFWDQQTSHPRLFWYQ